MAALLLTTCGLFLSGYGVWRSWSNGRRLLLPLAGPSESMGRARPGEQLPRPSVWPEVRHAAWHLALALGWLVLALLGLFMVTVAAEAAR